MTALTKPEIAQVTTLRDFLSREGITLSMEDDIDEKHVLYLKSATVLRYVPLRGNSARDTTPNSLTKMLDENGVAVLKEELKLSKATNSKLTKRLKELEKALTKKEVGK